MAKTQVQLSARTLAKAAAFVDWLVMNGVDRVSAADKVRIFAEEIAGKRPGSRTKVEPGTLLPVVDCYRALYRKKLGEWPALTGGDMATLKQLVANYGIALVNHRLQLLASTTNQWLQQQPFTPRTLHHQWARVAMLDSRIRPSAPADCKHEPRCTTAQKHNERFLLDAARSSSDETVLTAPATSRPNDRC